MRPLLTEFGLWRLLPRLGEDPKPTILTPDVLTRVSSLIEHGRGAWNFVCPARRSCFAALHWGLAPFQV
jgi:hypothetical protein